MKIQPTWDRVVVKKMPRKKTDGGIILPETEHKECEFGEVLAVGPGGFNMDGSRRPMGVKKGDLVFFDQYHSTTYKTTDVVIVDEEEILGILKE
jgi:chaperonin GroES